MAVVYYFKVTTNDSTVNELQEKKIKLSDIMSKVFKNINDDVTYEKHVSYYD